MLGGDKLLTIKEVMELAGVSRYTLYRGIRSGKVPSIQFGRNVRIRESDALAYAEAMGASKKVAYYRSKEG